MVPQIDYVFCREIECPKFFTRNYTPTGVCLESKVIIRGNKTIQGPTDVPRECPYYLERLLQCS